MVIRHEQVFLFFQERDDGEKKTFYPTFSLHSQTCKMIYIDFNDLYLRFYFLNFSSN